MTFRGGIPIRSSSNALGDPANENHSAALLARVRGRHARWDIAMSRPREVLYVVQMLRAGKRICYKRAEPAAVPLIRAIEALNRAERSQPNDTFRLFPVGERVRLLRR